jgi:predicted transcriptional regulator
MTLPNLSRFELQCLRALWSLKQGTVREVHGSLEDAPSYSTVRKIFERLEEKGAVTRVRLESRAWVYRPTVSRPAMVAKEVKRLLDGLFDGRADSLLAHLADTNELSLRDLRELETRIARQGHAPGASTEAKADAGTATGAGAGKGAGARTRARAGTGTGTGTEAGTATGTGTGTGTEAGAATGTGTAIGTTVGARGAGARGKAKSNRRSKP